MKIQYLASLHFKERKLVRIGYYGHFYITIFKMRYTSCSYRYPLIDSVWGISHYKIPNSWTIFLSDYPCSIRTTNFALSKYEIAYLPMLKKLWKYLISNTNGFATQSGYCRYKNVKTVFLWTFFPSYFYTRSFLCTEIKVMQNF